MSSPVFILLSAGKTRSRGNSNAAPLVPVNRTKLINKQISTIKKEYPRAKIILVVGYMLDEICLYMKKKHPNIKLVKNLDFQNTSSIHSLLLALDGVNNRDVFIIHGDRYFTRSTIKRRKRSFTSYVKIDNKNSNIGVSLNEKEELLYISYGLDKVWSEILFVKKEDIEKLKSISQKMYTIPEMVNLSTIVFDVVFDGSVKTLKEFL